MKKHYLLGILLIGILFISGCGEIYTQEEADVLIKSAADKARAEGVSSGVASVDTTLDDAEAIANAEPILTKEVADLKEQLLNVTAELGLEKAKPKADGTTTSTDSDTVIYVTGGYNIDNIKLNVGIDKKITDSKLDKLIDGEIKFTNEDETKDYDVSEVLEITDEAMIISSENKSKNGDTPYLILPKDSIIYKYQFDKKIDLSTITRSYPLTIKFLGKDVEIIDIEEGEMTIRTANDYFMNQGSSVIIGEKTIKLLAVGSASAIVVEVDGVMETIPATHTETVNGIEITNDEVFYDANNVSMRSATLYIGENVEVDIDDGDFYDDDELWKYEITTRDCDEGTENCKLTISLTLNEKHTKLEADYEPLKLGDSIELPEGYLKITFAKVEADYTTYELELEQDNCYRLSTKDEDIDDEYKKVFIENVTGGKIYKEDDCLPGEDNINLIGNEVTLGDSGITIGSNLILSTGLDFFNGLPDRDDDMINWYGIIVRDPENFVDEKEIEFDIPEEQLEVVVNVK